MEISDRLVIVHIVIFTKLLSGFNFGKGNRLTKNYDISFRH